MTISRNSDTVKFGREHRFLIDDPETKKKQSFLLTKPLRVGKTYNQKGVFSFVLQEVVSTDDDNMELGIANYYKHFPKTIEEEIIPPKMEGSSDGDKGKKVWI